jgi:hypothetical protein
MSRADDPRLCARPLIFWFRVGGKESTELVVRGERKRVPQEFVDELASFLGVSKRV